MNAVEPAKKTAETKQPVAKPEDAKKGKDDDSLAQAGKQALKTMMSPKEILSIAKEIDAVFGKTSIDTIKEVMPQSGLKSIDMKFFRAEYEGATIKTIGKCIRTVRLADPDEKEKMAQFLESLIEETATGTFLACAVTLDKGRGSQRRLYSAYRRSKWGAGSYDFFLQELDMKFELAPTLIIESHYRKSFCHEKYFESVREVPANLTAESAELLFGGLMGYLLGDALKEPMLLTGGSGLVPEGKMIDQGDGASEASTQQPPVDNEDMADTLL